MLVLNAVSAQIKVSKSVFDYGKVEIWKNDTFSFVVENKGRQPARLLPTYNPRVQLIGPTTIPAGSEIEYKIVAYPRAKGFFEFQPTFYFSNSIESLNLTIRGKIKSFDESALYNCPKLQNDPVEFKPKQLKIEVRDDETKRVIYHAETKLSNAINDLVFNGGYGKVNTFHGEYNIYSQAEGYEPKSVQIIFDASKDRFVIFLKPLKDELDEEVNYEPTSKETISLDHFKEDQNPEKEETISEGQLGKESQKAKKSILEELLKKEEKTAEVEASNEPEPLEIDKEETKEDFIEEEKIAVEKEGVVEKKDPVQELGEKLKNSELPPQHIIVLADVSFSMRRGGYLDDLKEALELTVQYLRPQDSLSIVTFSTSNIVLADHMGASDQDSILIAIRNIKARGGTNAKIALRSGYGIAKRYAKESNQTQLLLFTDGQFNTPGTSQNWYASYVRDNYLPKDYRLNILLFSERESDYKFLEPISSASGGATTYLNGNTSEMLLRVLNR